MANWLISQSVYSFESGDIEVSQHPDQMALEFDPTPVWFDGGPNEMLDSLISEVASVSKGPNSGAFADTVILVSTIEDGWNVCERLDDMQLPYITTFESREENLKIRENNQNKDSELVKKEIEKFRKRKKHAFWMQTGRIKVSTIHSFKGWELKRVIVFFNPTKKQSEKAQLLYTAITRSQHEVYIFNTNETVRLLAKKAEEEGLIKRGNKNSNRHHGRVARRYR